MEPSQKVDLPGQILYNQDVYLNTFRHGEVKEIFLIARSSDERRMISLLKRCINIDIKLLTPQDMWYIMYWERINSFPSNPMKIKWKCSHCGEVNTSGLAAKNLVVNDLDKDYHDGMGLQLPDYETPVYLRLNRLADESNVSEYYKNKNIIPDVGDTRDAMMASMLEPMGGTLEERLKVVQSFTPDDMFVLDEFERTFDYGVQKFGKFKCVGKECGEEANVAFDFSLASFFPELSDDRALRARILPPRANGGASDTGGRPGLRPADVAPEETVGRSESSEGPPASAGLDERSPAAFPVIQVGNFTPTNTQQNPNHHKTRIDPPR